MCTHAQTPCRPSVCVCARVGVCTCIQACTYLCMYVIMYVCVRACVRACVCMCALVYKCASAYKRFFMGVQACVCLRACLLICMFACMHIRESVHEVKEERS